MTATTRTRRIHMLGDPSWDPSNYQYVSDFDSTPEPPTFAWETKLIQENTDLLAASPTSEYAWDHSQCDHCGAHIRYVIVLQHTPTGDHIAIGQDCATERFGEPDRVSYLVKRAAQRRAAAKEREALSEKLAAFGAAHPGVNEFFQAYGEDHEAGVEHYSDGFILDVGRKLVKYGDISDRQIDAVGRAFTRDGEKERDRLLAALDTTPKAEVPNGRQTVTGTIISERGEDTLYGYVVKFLVETDEGYRLWGTKPASLDAAEPGDRVRYTATLKQSDKDKHFGFASRPTKGVIVQAGA